MDNAAKALKNVKLCENPYQVAEKADALVLATEWNEFKQLDFAKVKELMHQPVILDGRNLWDAQTMKDLGFIYMGVGRGNLKN
jgi:UDPglucose 6-dehydrogenase